MLGLGSGRPSRLRSPASARAQQDRCLPSLHRQALGVGSYFKDAWNDLDFFIVAISYVNLAAAGSGAEVGGLMILRVFRVLRPLRTIKRITGLRILVVSLLKSVPMMGNIMVIFFFMLLVFAIVGMQLYMGEFTQRCYDPASRSFPESDGVLCLPDDALLLGGRPCRAGLVCRKSGQAPAYGFVKFDNFFWAILTSFTCITTEGWHAGRRLEPARNLSTDPRPCA